MTIGLPLRQYETLRYNQIILHKFLAKEGLGYKLVGQEPICGITYGSIKSTIKSFFRFEDVEHIFLLLSQSLLALKVDDASKIIKTNCSLLFQLKNKYLFPLEENL